jgi:hypothetical protein
MTSIQPELWVERPRDALAFCRATRPPSRIRPAFPHKLAMPTQQRVQTDEERRPARSAQQSAGRSKEDAVTLVQPRTGDLAAKNREFVPEHHDLEFLELARAQPQRRHRKHTPK